MSHGTTRKAEYARQMNQSGRRKARRGRTINPPTKVILSKNRGKCAKYSSTGQVGNMNSVIWSCKSRSHPVKPQVAKIVRRRNARIAALLTCPVPSYFAYSGLKNDNMPQNYARNAFFAEETEYRLPETTIKSSGSASSLALSRASSKLCASTTGTSARPQAAHF